MATETSNARSGVERFEFDAVACPMCRHDLKLRISETETLSVLPLSGDLIFDRQEKTVVLFCPTCSWSTELIGWSALKHVVTTTMIPPAVGDPVKLIGHSGSYKVATHRITLGGDYFYVNIDRPGAGLVHVKRAPEFDVPRQWLRAWKEIDSGLSAGGQERKPDATE